MTDSLRNFQIEKVHAQRREEEESFVITEKPVTLFLNGQEVVTLLATPEKLAELAVGFMLVEGWLKENKPVQKIEVDPKGIVRVWAKDRNPLAPKLFLKRTITSGCGRGTIFHNVLDSLGAQKIRSAKKISPSQIFILMQQMNERSFLYQKSGSVHGAALADGKKIRIFCEDIGRHNAVDKVFGDAFLKEIPVSGKILLTTGRVSSEILVKAVKRRIPFLLSYSGPTDLAIDLARQIGITLIGYIRGNRMRIYSHGERVMP
jgi:FdhD protein